MKKYKIEFSPAAERALKKLAREVQLQVTVSIDALALNARPPGAKKLSGRTGEYRIRSGAYRVIYEIHDQKLIILILAVGDRKDIYRR